MKTFLFLLGLVAAGIVGYSFEPDMRFSLTGKSPDPKKGKPPIIAPIATQAEPEPEPEPPAVIDPSSIPPEELPKKVVLKTNVDITDEELDLKMTIAAGNPVDLIRIEGENAIISPGSEKYQATVPISQTDLIEQLTAPPAPAEPEIAVTPPPAPDPAAETPAVADPLADPAVTPEPAADPAAEPAPAAEPTPEPAAEPVAAAEPEPEPAPEPTPQPTPAAPATRGSVVAVMQSSIKGGDIKEFTYDQVLNWEASPAPETIDGESYQTGIASYKAETVFGVKTIQAKALIKGGKVVKWLWPKSGMEIK